MIGHNVASTITDSQRRWENRETSRWIGKPWRRVELVVQDYLHDGERYARDWWVTLSVGSIRLGWHFHATLTRSPGFDYSDEEHQ